MDALTKCDLLVRVGVDVLQELLDTCHLEICPGGISVETNGHHQVPELILIKYAISIHVHLLIHGDEVCKELFVLLQLEIEHALEKDCKLELTSLHIVMLVVHHGAGHRFTAIRLICSISCHQIAA